MILQIVKMYQKKIEIGKEIIYLTREECMNLGISVDDIIDFTKEALF